MTKIIDLDALIAPPIKVKLGGKPYLLPADIPMELFLAVKAREEREGDEADIVDAMKDQLIALFQVHQPAMKDLPPGIGMRQMFQIIPTIYRGEDDADEPEGKPTSAPTGSAKSKPKPKSPRKASSSPS